MGKRSILLILVLSIAVVFSMASNCPAPICGDNIINRLAEVCDGTADAACPGQCLPDCTCPPVPICGDNIVNRPEEVCDGTDDEACPGQCTIECTCSLEFNIIKRSFRGC